jgi:hypothetical protein
MHNLHVDRSKFGRVWRTWDYLGNQNYNLLIERWKNIVQRNLKISCYYRRIIFLCVGDRSALHLFEGNSPQFSIICLCAMIWRQQNNECVAFTQLKFVQSFGTGLFEAVGMYLVLSRPGPYVLTESYTGN